MTIINNVMSNDPKQNKRRSTSFIISIFKSPQDVSAMFNGEHAIFIIGISLTLEMKNDQNLQISHSIFFTMI